MWLAYQRWWCEHKPSITVSVKEHEWPAVGAWVWAHFDEMSGVSFLPFSDSTYKQMPYQDCNRDTFDDLVAKMPKDIDWSLLAKYEATDMTEGAQLLACVSGACEL
jgi:ribonucleoside-diphosphate reductase alpha chain